MHCTDDRGKRVRLIPQYQLGITPGIPSPIPIEVRTRMFGEAQEIQLSREFIVPMLLALLAIFIWGGAWLLISPRILPALMVSPTIKALITTSVPFLCIPFLMWFLMHRTRQRIVRIVTHHRFCATCGYALADIPPAEDRCTVCPECGSAWRLPAPSV